MTSRPLRLCLALLLGILLAPAHAQGAGVTLGFVGEIDAPVLDAPPDASGYDQVALRTFDGVDLALASLCCEDDPEPRLRGDLPDLRGSHLLHPVTSEELWPCPIQATSVVGFLPVSLWVVGTPAVLELASGPLPAQPGPGYRQLLLVFVDGDTRLTGLCLENGTGLQLDAYLRPGWNLLTSELIGTAAQEVVLLRNTSAADLEAAAWYWRDVGGQASPTGPVPRVEPAPERP